MENSYFEEVIFERNLLMAASNHSNPYLPLDYFFIAQEIYVAMQFANEILPLWTIFAKILNLKWFPHLASKLEQSVHI